MLFNASKWLWKVPDPNFPNWDLPLKWLCKLIPPIFFHSKRIEIDDKQYNDPIQIILPIQGGQDLSLRVLHMLS
jgi:hypothetical protein